MKKMFASVLSVLLCCAFFAGCSSPEPDSPKISTLLNSVDLIYMDGESLEADGFSLKEDEYISTYDKVSYTEFDDNTTISVCPNTFATYHWFFENDLISPKYQLEEIVDLFTKKFGKPELKYNGNSVELSDSIVDEAYESAENSSGYFSLDYSYNFAYTVDNRRYSINITNYVFYGSGPYNSASISASIIFAGTI